MSALADHYLALLQTNLAGDYVTHLPQLLPNTKPTGEVVKKNLSRAFSAFALRHIAGCSTKDAAASVVDDFDDFGVDAIYLHAPTETLYLVQSKIKASEQFSQDEALAFCQGVRKLLKQDFDGFNKHVLERRTEIEDALDNCSVIQVVVAHVGSGISARANVAVEELLADDTHGEERLKRQIIDFDAVQVVAGLQQSNAYDRVDTRIFIAKCKHVTDPKITYFGLANLTDLIALHRKHGKALYEKNIRTFLGHTTDVNVSIQHTLATNPKHFFYLNNGVTVLCQKIDPKSETKFGKKLDVTGFSVINGAQTIASSAKFAEDNRNADLQSARVSITLVQSDLDTDFGKSVTRARNHQNQIHYSNFVALHAEQERLRRDLAHLGIHYNFKAGVPDGNEVDRFTAEDAAHALALFHADPRYVVWLKTEGPSLLDTSSVRYSGLFNPEVTAFQLANAVRFTRFVVARMTQESKGHGPEKLTYKHGAFAFGWLLAQQVRNERDAARLFDPAKLPTALSTAADNLRQLLWTCTDAILGSKTPNVLFKGQQHVIPLLSNVMIQNYGLTADPAIAAKQRQQNFQDPYPIDLFKYIRAKAPQITGLA